MTINLSTLRSEVREHLAVDVNDLGNPSVDLLLNRTYWELCEKFHVRETESATTLTTNAGQREYLLPPDFESLRISAITDLDTFQHTGLDQFSVKDYESKYNEDSVNQGKPTNYFRADESIILWPTPDDTYTITIHYRKRLEDLATDSAEPELPRSWQEGLILGAVYRGWLKLNDYDRASAMKAHYIQFINSLVPQEAKEALDYRTAGVQLLGNEY